ncbi:Cro/CI family transcriptional regulator [Pseudomonas putida]|uniref:Cro/CI family transcriptional regulator n=1 Tax=Pseudomonas putida TaxID=303 RepID=UPI000CD409FF
MTTLTLSEFVEPIGQAEAAKKLGSSQVAISKALRSERLIVVASRADGSLSSFEIKPFPCGNERGKGPLNLGEIVAQVALIEQPGKPSVHPSSTGQGSR